MQLTDQSYCQHDIRCDPSASHPPTLLNQPTYFLVSVTIIATIKETILIIISLVTDVYFYLETCAS